MAHFHSFSRAAKSLKIPKATVSRKVSELEKQLSATLLLRTTRSLSLTEVGRVYFEQALLISSQLEQALSLANDLGITPQGILKISTTTDLEGHFLQEVLCRFLKSYPKINAEIHLTNRLVDLVSEGFDVAIRVGDLKDSSLISKKIGEIQMRLYASPAFIKENGEPKNIAQLEKFNCLLFSSFKTANQWDFYGAGKTRSISVQGRIAVNNLQSILQYALSGQGIALLPQYFCKEEVQKNKLIPILGGWNGLKEPVQLVYPSQRFLLPRVRAFIDCFSESKFSL